MYNNLTYLKTHLSLRMVLHLRKPASMRSTLYFSINVIPGSKEMMDIVGIGYAYINY